MSAQDLESNLCQFTGTEQWHRHGLNRNMLYTDGAQYFAENAGGGAYWFLDIVATEIFALQKAEPFICIDLIVWGDKPGARIVATDGNDNEIWAREIEYTDCPIGNWKFYLTDNVMLLPSEY
jgi:hypothetical protein